MLLSPLLRTRHLNSKQNLLEVIELFSLCAQSGLNFKQLHQQEIDQKQMSTLLSSFPDSTDSILNEHTEGLCFFIQSLLLLLLFFQENCI